MLTYSIQHLHNYLFSTMASVTTVGKFADSHRAKKHKEINEFFHRIIAPEMKSQFNAFVRQLNNTALKNALSISETAENSSSVYFPEENVIDAAFDELNEQYNIFDSSDNALKPAFQVYFKTAKVIGDFIERNNYNNNSVAYLHAYKMMVLFGGEVEIKNYFKALDSFLLSHNGFDHAAPVHDALIYGLPTCHPAETKLGLNHWRKMFMAHGRSAVNLFASATEIEKELGKAPENYKQALQVAANLQFARAVEYPELAELCKHYKLSEDTFNRCLEIDKLRKKSDILPDIIIDGSDHGHPGYHLLKLPISDPHAYFLGHITNCCQSIGGHAEKCVIDGVTLKTNGFYVLVKNIKKIDVAASPLKNGCIDYSRFKIAGQGYAWLSEWGNLAIDSWQNLNHSSPDDEPSMVQTDDDVIVPMLTAFSKVATHDYPGIVRVTIGIGGDTPEAFETDIGIINNPEKMLAGFQYGDSVDQFLIYENTERKQQVVTRTKLLLEKLSDAVINSFDLDKTQSSHFIGADMITNIPVSLAQTDELENIVGRIIASLDRDRAIFAEILTFVPPDNLGLLPIEESLAEKARKDIRYTDPTAIFTQPELLKHFSANKLSLWRALTGLSENGLLTRSNAGILLSQSENTMAKVRAMLILNRAGILNNKNMRWLAEENDLNACNIPKLVTVLVNLEKHGQLTQDNFDALRTTASNFGGRLPPYFYEKVDTHITNLHRDKLLTSRFVHVLLSHHSAYDVYHAIHSVLGLNLNDDEIVEIVITRKHTLKEMTDALNAFNRQGIASTQNVKLFFRLLQMSDQLEIPSAVSGLASVISNLNELTDENIRFLEMIALKKVKFDYPSFSNALTDIARAFADDPIGLNKLLNEFFTNPNYQKNNLSAYATIYALCKSNGVSLDTFLAYASDNKNVDQTDLRYLTDSLLILSKAKLLTVENLHINSLNNKETTMILGLLSSRNILTQSCYDLTLRVISNVAAHNKIIIQYCFQNICASRFFNEENVILLLSLAPEKLLACCTEISKKSFVTAEIFHATITKFTETTDTPLPPRMNT